MRIKSLMYRHISRRHQCCPHCLMIRCRWYRLPIRHWTSQITLITTAPDIWSDRSLMGVLWNCPMDISVAPERIWSKYPRTQTKNLQQGSNSQPEPVCFLWIFQSKQKSTFLKLGGKMLQNPKHKSKTEKYSVHKKKDKPKVFCIYLFQKKLIFYLKILSFFVILLAYGIYKTTSSHPNESKTENLSKWFQVKPRKTQTQTLNDISWHTWIM